MERRLLLVLCAPICLAACGDEFEPASGDKTGGAGASASASGSGGGSDGGDGGSSTASGTGTGGAEAAPPHEITVRDQDGEPVVDVPIVINAADGSIVSSTKTDASGTVEVEIPEDGSVSAFWTYELGFHIDAVHSPPEGAPIRFAIAVAKPETPPTEAPTTYHIFPFYPSGTKSLGLGSNCVSASTFPGQHYPDITNENCLDDETQDFIFTAYNGLSQLIGWATWLDAPKSPGATVNKSLAVVETAIDTVDMSLVDLPWSTTRADLDVSIEFHNARYQRGSIAAPPSDSTYHVTHQLPSIDGAEYALIFHATVGDVYTVGASVRHDESAASLPSSVSFSPESFTWLSANPLDASDPEHPTASWSTSKKPAADHTWVRFGWSGGSSYGGYNAYFPPHSVTKVRLPDIPEELSSYRPVATSTFSGPEVFCGDYEGVDGYAGWIDGAEPGELEGNSTYASAWNYQ